MNNFFFEKIFIIFLFHIIIIIFLLIYNKKELLNLKKDLYHKLRNINESLININNINNITNVNTFSSEIFNENINKQYIQKQKDFCNLNLYYNQEYENQIKLADASLFDMNFKLFVYKKNDIVSKYIINSKKWESSHTLKVINALNYYKKKNIKKEGIYFIDIGANIGWYSIFFGKLGYKIIGFEPSKINYYILSKNYCLNKEINLTIINKGLYTKEQKSNLYKIITNKGDGAILIGKKNFYLQEEIILTKLSNYIPFLSDKNIGFIKIDIEGSEAKAFEGGIELISKYHIPFILLEFTPRFLKLHGSDPKEFLQMFINNGYKIVFQIFLVKIIILLMK